MPLQRQTPSIPVLGMDTNVDPKSAAPGTFELVENMYLKRRAAGGAELVKRNGGTSLTRNIIGAGSISMGRKLATHNNERLLTSDTTLYSYISQAARWQSRGLATTIALTSEVFAPDTISAGVDANPDVAFGGGYICLAYISNVGNGNVTIIDNATGERVLHNQNLAGFNGNAIRVIALSDRFVVMGWSATGASAVVTAHTILYATPQTPSGSTSILADLNTVNPRFDCVKNGGLDNVMCAYQRTGGTLKVIIVNANLSLGATANGADSADMCIGFFTWDGSDNNNYVGYVGAAGIGARFATVTTAAVISGTTVMDAAVVVARNITGYRTGTTNVAFIEVTNATTYNSLIRRWPGSGASAVWQRSCALGSRAFPMAFTAGAAAYVTASYESPLQATYYLLDATAAVPVAPFSGGPPIVAKWFYGLAGGDTSRQSTLNSVAALSASVWCVPCRVLVTARAFVGFSGFTNYGAALVRLDFAGTGLGGYRKVGANLHLTGGVSRIYDGRAASESGFHHFPETPAASAGGGGTFTGTFQVCTVFYWIDATGGEHRSAPSAVATVTLAAQVPTIVQPTLRLSDHPQASAGTAQVVMIELYRTLDGDTTFYLDARQANDNGADTITFATFGSTDANLPAQQKLYTTGGVLPHIPPPPAKFEESYKNRNILSGTEFGTEVWISNESVPGEGISYSDALVLVIEQEGGNLTAIAEDDERLIFFKRKAIYTLSGNLPTLNGAGMDGLEPQQLSEVVGAISQAGVIKTPQGVLFKSTRGYHMLPKGGGQPIRLRGIEAYESLTPTGAVVMETLEQVRITTSEGRTLVYHWGFLDETGAGRWTSFTNQAAVDAVVWNGTYVTLASDGTVTEESAAYSDPGGVAINAKARFTWLNLAGLFGEVRLWALQVLLEIKATFTLGLSIAVDFDSTPVESPTLAVTTATKKVERKPARQGAEAYQVTVEETSTTQGFTLSGLGLELGAEGKLKRPATAQRMT